MKQEVWATYSVKDHLDPRPIATDIMLFDRLVFPVPELSSFPEGSAPPDQPGDIAWERDPEEWARWQRNRWMPENQQRVLGWLEKVVQKYAWRPGEPAFEEYRSETAKQTAPLLHEDYFKATRTALNRNLPAYVSGVSAIGPTYHTLDELTRELGVRDARGHIQLPGGALAHVLAWEFIAPDHDDPISTDELLSKTIEFATKNHDFQTHRAEFWEWQQKFLDEGKTDPESIDRAIKVMKASLDRANQQAEKLTMRKCARYATRFAAPLLALGAAIAGVAGPEVASGGLAIAIGGVIVDEKLFPKSEKGMPAATAFVVEAQRLFGRK
jgi:hypothetical protein